MHGPQISGSTTSVKRAKVLAVHVASAVPRPAKQTAKPTKGRWRYRFQVASLSAVVSLCVARAVWLMFWTLSPNAMMNRMMTTTEYDYGTFWRIVDPEATVVYLGVAGLAIVTLGYALIPFWWTGKCFSRVEIARRASTHMSLRVSTSSFSSRVSSRVSVIVSDHRPSSIVLKLGDLAVQIVFLVQQMEAGMPVILISFMASIIAVNAATTATLVWSSRPNVGFRHAVIDTALDFLVAVVYPGFVVVYCVTHFTFDRPVMAINAQVFVESAFERVGAMLASPVQVEIIRHSLDSLRIASLLDVFTRVGVNGVLCFRLHLLAQYVVASRGKHYHRANEYPKNRVASVAFAVVALGVVLFTSISIHTSAVACKPHPECAQSAHRWIGSSARCPCIAFVDRELVVRSYDEWTPGRDITDKVAALAMSGDLQTLQIVNRVLPAFPESLRKCTNLKHISLMYTHTQSLPTWFREFSKLEYLHIEGTLDNTSINQIPTDAFDNLTSLTFLHLGLHLMPRLPSFHGLARLKILTLAMLIKLEEIPSFDRLTHLERLTLVSLPLVETLPDLSNAKRLQMLSANDRGAFCCNGFLDGQCDLNEQKCREHPKWGTPAATCLPRSRYASPATLAVVRHFYNATCTSRVLPKFIAVVPEPYGVRQCNGSMFRQCSPPGFPTAGICFNTRFMVISCDSRAAVADMRRQQIARGLGLPCDPAHEAWLGCRAD